MAKKGSRGRIWIWLVSHSVFGCAAKIDWYGSRSAAMASHLRQLDVDKDKRVALADGVSRPFRRASSDKVLCTGVLMHIAETDLAVRELVRVLRNGGRIVSALTTAFRPIPDLSGSGMVVRKDSPQSFATPRRFANFSIRLVWQLTGSKATALSQRSQ